MKLHFQTTYLQSDETHFRQERTQSSLVQGITATRAPGHVPHVAGEERAQQGGGGEEEADDN